MNQNQRSFLTIGLTAIVTALATGSFLLVFGRGLNQTPEVQNPSIPPFTPRSLLVEKEGYSIPFGAAEIEGYYTQLSRGTSLDQSTPNVDCSGFVITKGPEQLLRTLPNQQFGTPPAVVLGPADMYLGAIRASSKVNPIRVIATLSPTFEGELIGCMPWPFVSLTEIPTDSAQK